MYIQPPQQIKQIVQNDDVITILSCGKPGVGKSSIGNHILTGNPNSNLFKQGQNYNSFGLTTQIQGEIRRMAFPNGRIRNVQYLDIPGVGDLDIDVEKFVNDIKLKYSKTKINIALMIVSAYETRKIIQEAFCIAFYKSFFDQNGLKSKDVLYLVITRYQECQMTDEQISMKLNSLAQDGLEIDPSRVIKYRLGFDQDLQPLMMQIQFQNSQLGYNFKKDYNSGLCAFQENMDKIVGKNKQLKYELDSLTKTMEKLSKQNQDLKEQMNSNQKMFLQALHKMTEEQQSQQKNFQSFIIEQKKNQNQQQDMFLKTLNEQSENIKSQQSMYQNQLKEERIKYESELTNFQNQLMKDQERIESQQIAFQAQLMDERKKYESQQIIFQNLLKKEQERIELQQSRHETQLNEERKMHQLQSSQLLDSLKEVKESLELQQSRFETQLEEEREVQKDLESKLKKKLCVLI